MAKKNVDYDSEASEEFLRTFSSGVMSGGCRILCDVCNRLHFASEAGFDFEEGELGELQKNENEKPGEYIDHFDCAVESITIGGNSHVVGCPCNALGRYEDFIWGWRDGISRYLHARAERKFLEAMETSGRAQAAADSVSKLEED